MISKTSSLDSKTSIKERSIPLDSKTEWAEALRGLNHAFAHTWESCHAMHLSSGLPTFLYYFERRDRKIACPFAERQFNGTIDIVTPYGLSGFAGNGDSFEFAEHWKNFAKNNKYVCGYVSLNPLLENKTYFSESDYQAENSIHVIDLTLSEKKLFANLTKNAKTKLKEWEKTGSKIITEKTVLKKHFRDLYLESLKRVHAAPIYFFSEETLDFILNLKNIFLIGAERGGTLEAVSLFTHTPYIADYYLNASSLEGRRHSAILLWKAVAHLKSLEIPSLNLGGGITEGDGLSKFKARFGGSVYPMGALKQVYDPEKYLELCKVNHVDPDIFKGYFPPYRSRRS